jgi:low temperature requirement protein LtrA
MGTTLLMATAVPDASGESSTQFGITFFAVRLLAGGLYWVAAADYPAQRKAFYTFFPLSQAGATMILIGAFLEGPWLWGFWIAGAALDLYSAVNAGRGTWAVDAGHFAERNGLFIIIALGESVVGIGLTFAGVEHDPANVVALIVAFAGIAALWWAYFDHAAPYVEAHFKGLQGQERGRFARDAYSFLHYPLVVGIVFFAVGLEEVVTHPLDPLSEVGRLAIGLGTALVLMSIVAGVYRAVQRVAAERLIASSAVLALVWVGSTWNALTFVSVSVAATVIALSLERGHTWPEPRVATPDAP